MTGAEPELGGDLLRAVPPGTGARFFDRFVFDLSPADAATPTLHVGVGAHPSRDVLDGFVLAVLPTQQRNHRLSTRLTASDPGRLGGLTWSTHDDSTWRLALEPTRLGVAFELIWTPRAPAWSGVIRVGEAAEGDEATAFAHLFQSGRYDGWVEVDRHRTTVAGWPGARDRSRGVRTLRGGQGLHLWVQAHLPDATAGFLLVEDRAGGRILLEGAVMGVDGTLDAVVEVRHALAFDALDDLDAARFAVTCASGRVLDLEADTAARGGWMAGGGYGGGHGEDRGASDVQDDVYPIDGTVGPRTLDTALTDRTAFFRDRISGAAGVGILEFARTRSPSYRYRRTIRDPS